MGLASFWADSTFEIDNFERAKKALRRIYRAHPIEFYCGCPIQPEGNNRYTIAIEDCGLQARKNPKRLIRLEWEHIVPASRFGQSLDCWSNCPIPGKKGRACCRKVDSHFQKMEGDMHNLVPSSGELNADRGNYSFGEVPGEPRAYGICDFEVDFRLNIVEVRPEIRGDIARAYLYMEEKYGIGLTTAEKEEFKAWHEKDPPDAWEREKAKIVERLQGNKHPLIE